MRPTAPDPETPSQVIPRPPVTRPGGPAPWASLDPSLRRGLTVAQVVDRLSRAGWTGPEPPATETAVDVFDGPLADGSLRRSAVLVGLFDEDGEARVLLTRRSTRLRSHRGEISFPGGRMEPGEDPVTAAFREAFEEVGLDPATARPVGWLHPVLTFVSNSVVTPVVAVLDPPPSALVPNPDEVDRAFDVPLAHLLADGVYQEEYWTVPGRRGRLSADGSYPIRFFGVAGETVWGATGRMLYQLLCVALGLDPSGA